MIDPVNAWRHKRRPADTTDVCLRPGCGVSLAGRVSYAKWCSKKCGDIVAKQRKAEAGKC